MIHNISGQVNKVVSLLATSRGHITKQRIVTIYKRCGEEVTHVVHTHKNAGANPATATKFCRTNLFNFFFLFRVYEATL